MADESKPPLQYQVSPSPVTRGQFRLLLLLMLIQVVISAQSAYAPGFIAWVKQQWADHQEAVAHRAMVQKNLAAAHTWLSHVDPPETVVWDEDPARAGKLLAGSGYVPIQEVGQLDEVKSAVPPGARRAMATPPAVAQSRFGGVTFVFVHGRHAPGAPERLVAIGVSEALNVADPPHTANAVLEFAISKHQTFSAASFGISADKEFEDDGSASDDLDLQPEQFGVEMPAHWKPSPVPGNPGTLRIEYRDQLRVFAGQADPGDPSHFTIAYDLDGQPGVIDGWLKADGSVMLEPRVGKRVNHIWYPHAK